MIAILIMILAVARAITTVIELLADKKHHYSVYVNCYYYKFLVIFMTI